MATERLQAFPYYGGKFSHLGFILPRLPQEPQYVEPFGGSAAVLLSREPASVETYNDIDGDMVTFFRVLRDQPEELIGKLEQTPYARSEYDEARAAAGDEDLSDVERARLFYVRAAQVYSGLAQYATPGRWSYSVASSVRDRANTVAGWQHDVSELEAVAGRLRRVQIEHDDALEVIQRYDHEDALIYCDPPYPMDSRGSAGCGTADPVAYGSELDEDDHRELCKVLVNADAKVAVSSYRNRIYDEELEDWWVASDAEKSIRTKHDADLEDRQEVLYTNYDPEQVRTFQQAALVGFTEDAEGRE